MSFSATMSLVLVLAAGQQETMPERTVQQAAQTTPTMAFHQVVFPSFRDLLGASSEAEPVGRGAPGAVPAKLDDWVAPVWFADADREALLAIDAMGRDTGDVGPNLRLSSRAVFAYDVESGEILYSRAADDRRPVASLTKVQAALALVSEYPDLDREVCLDQSTRPSWPGAVTKLRTGYCMSGWDYLGAALVRSDNRAAYAFAPVSGLPHERFVDRMNQVADELGMDQSTFSDPSGVEDDNLSTARDMTRAVLAASIHQTLAPVVSAPFWDVKERNWRSVRRLFTTNRLHGRGSTEILAAKTGYTNTARYCFSTVMRLRDQRKVALTTLGARWSRQRWSDVRALVQWLERGGDR